MYQLKHGHVFSELDIILFYQTLETVHGSTGGLVLAGSALARLLEWSTFENLSEKEKHSRRNKF